ncbi:hypothetical protein TrST_g7959 [Triparma strigata]|uniref:Uncharacterized protein n=1 Tax=Triparma strigata TaxID=1606541 RepID=A0A9W7EEP2_9STRA|nr:hypothetical protein TrST_g7959 [Triparma strigata]
MSNSIINDPSGNLDVISMILTYFFSENSSEYSTLSRLSNVNKCWREIVENVFIKQNAEGEYCVSEKLSRCLFWFPPERMETRTVNLRVHDKQVKGKRNGVEIVSRKLLEVWSGEEGVEGVLKMFGFAESFISRLEDKLCINGGGVDSNGKSVGLIDSLLGNASDSSGSRGLDQSKSLVVGTSKVYPTTIEEQPQVLKGERPTECVQFLSVDGGQAVRLMSNAFECGVVEQPITIFCVGIGMEDGCFLSGLRKRFELGHMYPSEALESFLDRSRIKCCAAKTQVREKMSDRFRGMNVSDSDSSSSGSDSSSDGSMLSASSLPPAEEIMEGKSRPGNWHLYTCVYDGVNSYIRVDGKYEGEGNVGDGGLDGIQLGSDHTFNLSLCDGGAGLNIGEAGGGAIAEVGAFGAVMSPQDMEVIEERLMAKHGITKATDMSVQEAEWGFHATALIHQNQPWRLVKKVPLRIAARERSVVWTKMEPVSGVKINVSRIGTNKFDSDSEW